MILQLWSILKRTAARNKQGSNEQENDVFSGSRQGQSWRFVPAVPFSVWTWYESIKKSGFNIFSGCTKDRGALQAWLLLDPVSRFCVQTAKKQQHFPPEKVLHAVKHIGN